MTVDRFIGDPNDVRFQFEVIKSLADSVREMGTTQTRMLERLARIEEHRTNEEVAKVKTRLEVLEAEKLRRDGASRVVQGLKEWWPIIGMALLVVWTVGRALGFFHLPEAREVSIINRDGKPELHSVEPKGNQ